MEAIVLDIVFVRVEVVVVVVVLWPWTSSVFAAVTVVAAYKVVVLKGCEEHVLGNTVLYSVVVMVTRVVLGFTGQVAGVMVRVWVITRLR